MKKRRAPPSHGAGAGDTQLLIETLGCLLLRGESDHLEIGPAERVRLYGSFPGGWGLMAYDETASGTIRLTLTGEAALPLLEDLIEDAASGRVDRVPGWLKPDRGATHTDE